MNDCISRQAVLDKLNEWDWQELYLPIHFKELIIDELPSVTPTERTGHWVYIDEKKAKCSECGYIQITGGKDKTGHCNIHYAIYKYCTNCGVKMVKPQESEEISERNMKMWEEIFKAERNDEE